MKRGKKKRFLGARLPDYKHVHIEIEGRKYYILYNTKLGYVNEVRIFPKSLTTKEFECRIIKAADFKGMWKYIFMCCFYSIRHKITEIFKRLG